MEILTFDDVWGKFPVSPSTLIVAGCPEALRKKKEGVPPDTGGSDLAQFGRDAHAIFDAINKYRAPMNDSVLDEIITEFATADFEYLRRMALKYISVFPMRFIQASELKLALDINLKPCGFHDDEARFRGIIDILTGEHGHRRITVIDHKTGFAVYNPDTEQNRFYAWLVYRNFPDRYDSIGMGINFMRYGQLRYSNRDITNFDNLERSIVAQAEKVWRTPKDAPACAGKQCQFCNWPISCSLVQSGEISRITTPEMATIMAGETLVLERRLKEMKTKLRVWANIHGTVPVGDTWEYSFKSKPEISFDMDDLRDKVAEYPSLLDSLKVNKRRTDDLLEHPANIKFLETVNTRFQGRKVEND